jgi:hypothetical protein
MPVRLYKQKQVRNNIELILTHQGHIGWLLKCDRIIGKNPTIFISTPALN